MSGPSLDAPGSAGPERLLVAPVLRDEQPPHGWRYLLVRWPDWPHPTLLSLAAPGPGDSMAEAVRVLIEARLRLACEGEPRASETRVPVRMPLPRVGGEGQGWLRPVVVRVSGEPQPDALLAGVEAFTLEQALAALPTEVERTVLRAAAALLD